MANRIKETREKLGISLSKLSRMAEVPKSSLSEYENGDRQPRDNATWERLSEKLGVSIPYLMGLSNEQKEPEDMNLKELILKANSLAHGDPDPDNAMRVGYLISNIEAFTEVITSAISTDYENNQELGRMVMDFLGATSYLLQNGDTDSLTNLQKLTEQLTSFNKGLYRGTLFQAKRIETSGDKERHFTDEARQDEAVANYFDYTKKINDILNEYFLTQFNQRYNK